MVLADLWAALAVARSCRFHFLGLVLPAREGSLVCGAKAEAVVLVKPSSRWAGHRVRQGGVVRDPVAHADALEAVDQQPPQQWDWLALQGWWAPHRSLVRLATMNTLLWLRPGSQLEFSK